MPWTINGFRLQVLADQDQRSLADPIETSSFRPNPINSHHFQPVIATVMYDFLHTPSIYASIYFLSGCSAFHIASFRLSSL